MRGMMAYSKSAVGAVDEVHWGSASGSNRPVRMSPRDCDNPLTRYAAIQIHARRSHHGLHLPQRPTGRQTLASARGQKASLASTEQTRTGLRGMLQRAVTN